MAQRHRSNPAKTTKQAKAPEFPFQVYIRRPEHQSLIRRAAELSEMTLSTFIGQAAIAEASRVVEGRKRLAAERQLGEVATGV